MDKPGLGKASGLWHSMLNESSDYLDVYALVDTLVKECHEVDDTPSGRRATEEVADAIRFLLPEFQNRVDPKLLVLFMRCTVQLGSHLADTSTPEWLFRKMQASSARKKKEIKDTDRARKLDDAVRAECADQGRAIAISIKLANLIQTGVRKKLHCKQADTWPSQSAIKGALGRLRAAKARRNDRAMDKPHQPEPSSRLHRMLNEWSDYSQAYAVVDTLVRKCHEVEETPSGRRATEKIADAVKLLLPEFQYRVDPTLVVNLMLCTAALGRFQVNTSTPKRLFRKNQAYIARKKKEIQDADRARKLDDAVRAECAERGRAISISIEFANLIRPGVRKRLSCKQDDEWPSQSRIKNSLRHLKSGQNWKK